MKSLYGLLLFFVPLAHASDFDIRIIERSNLADEDIFQVGSWEAIQVSKSNKAGLYAFASGERASIFPQGYHGFDYVMYSIGVGKRVSLGSSLKLFGQIGISKVNNSWGGRKPKSNEAFEYYLNRKWYGLSGVYSDGSPRWLTFDAYRVKNSDAMTAEIGLEFRVYHTDTSEAFSTASYRLLKINEKIQGFRAEWDALGPGQYWTSSQNRNYSSINIGFGYRRTF